MPEDDALSMLLGLSIVAGFLDATDAVHALYTYGGARFLPMSICPRRVADHRGSEASGPKPYARFMQGL